MSAIVVIRLKNETSARQYDGRSNEPSKLYDRYCEKKCERNPILIRIMVGLALE